MSSFAFLWLGLLTAIPAFTQGSWTVSSPDSAVQVRASLGEKLSYTVAFHNRPALTDSPLGLEFDGRPALNGASLKLADQAERSSDTTWTNKLGKNSSIRDNYKELTLVFGTGDPAIPKLNVVFRAYNDGVAFRYSIPGAEGSKQSVPARELILKREVTEF